MTTTLREIADHTRHAALLELLEQEAAEGGLPIEVSNESDHGQQVKAAFRALVVAAFDDDALDIAATLARIKEVLRSYERLVGKVGADDSDGAAEEMSEAVRTMPSEVRLELSQLREELERLRRRDAARQILEEEGLEIREVSPERLRLLHAQADDAAMRSLVESWPPYVRRPRRRATDLREPAAVDRYPQSLDEFVAALR
ncbi:MAG: hypothetical protein RIC55_21345 [Pirellulaceae bacterium]